MKLFYGMMTIDAKALMNFLKELPSASSNAIHR